MAVYSAIHDSKGDLFVATIDTNLMDTVTPEYLKNEINLEESVVKSDVWRKIKINILLIYAAVVCGRGRQFVRAVSGLHPGRLCSARQAADL